MNLQSVIGVFLRLVVIEAYSLSRCLWVWLWGNLVELFTAVRATSVDGRVGLQSFGPVNHAGCVSRALNIGGEVDLPALSVGYGPSIYYSLQTDEEFGK